MLVKNIGNKTIGFGAIHIAPDEVKELPEGYGKEHPTVAFYLMRKYLIEAENPADESGGTGNAPPQVDPFALTDEQKAAAAAEQKKAELEALVKTVGEMKNRDPLRDEARKLGIDFKETDTVEVLKQKITEKLQADITELG